MASYSRDLVVAFQTKLYEQSPPGDRLFDSPDLVVVFQRACFFDDDLNWIDDGGEPGMMSPELLGAFLVLEYILKKRSAFVA